MMLFCDACGASNFVSPERLAVPGRPPVCWKCFAPLPVGGETVSGRPESKGASKEPDRTGEVGNA